MGIWGASAHGGQRAKQGPSIAPLASGSRIAQEHASRSPRRPLSAEEPADDDAGQCQQGDQAGGAGPAAPVPHALPAKRGRRRRLRCKSALDVQVVHTTPHSVGVAGGWCLTADARAQEATGAALASGNGSAGSVLGESAQQAAQQAPSARALSDSACEQAPVWPAAGQVAAPDAACSTSVALTSVTGQVPIALASGSPITSMQSRVCTFGHTVSVLLGEGAFGKVFAATTSSGDQVAIKHIDCNPGEMPSLLQREVTILQQLTHPHIVRLLEVNRMCFAIDLVFELCETTLRRIIKHSANSELLSSSTTSRYALQLFEALAYVHSKDIMHRDVKPANVLVNGSMRIAKLADFGWARPVPRDKRCMLTRGAYTLWYRPPEVLLGTAFYTYPSDVWAMGCVCLEMGDLKLAFAAASEKEVLANVFQALGNPSVGEWPGLAGLPKFRRQTHSKPHAGRVGVSLAWGKRIGPEYTSLLQGVLRAIPAQRWSAQQCDGYCRERFTATGADQALGSLTASGVLAAVK